MTTNTKWATALIAVVVAVAIGSLRLLPSEGVTMSTFGDTVSWTAGTVKDCGSIEEVVKVVLGAR